MTKAAVGSSSTPSSSVSTLTPRQRMSRWVHFVTQLMSTTHSRLGSARNSSHVQRTGSPTSPSIENDQRSSGVRGVGPAESTGKSVVRYWPGGMRVRGLPTPGVARRPTNPRVTKRSAIDRPSRSSGWEHSSDSIEIRHTEDIRISGGEPTTVRGVADRPHRSCAVCKDGPWRSCFAGQHPDPGGSSDDPDG